jgi:outer membrane protein assembly factor BamB
MRMVRSIILISVLLTTSQVVASDWPQYLGPDRNAVSSEKGLLRSWPEEGPKVLWTIPLGEGFGGAAISEGKVYVYDRVEDKTNILRCLDLMTGREEWTFTNEAPGSVSFDGTRAVPTVDGNRIYICDLFGNFHCIDKNTHEVLWQKNIWTDFGGNEYPRWAIAQNPLIYQNMVIVASQTEEAGIVAYDKENGNILWKTSKLQGNAGYVSPAIVKLNEEDHLIMVTASGMFNSPDKGAVSGFKPKTGALIWSFDGWQCGIPVPNVTQISKNRIFITAGYGSGGTIMEINKNGDSYAVKEILHTEEFETHAHPAILYKEHLYGHCTNNTGKMDGFICMDLMGNIKWKTKKKPFFDKGGMILVDDMIISSDGEKMLYLIEPTPTEFKVLAKAELLDTKQSWAPLALSDGKLVIRDQGQMKCVLVK